MAWCTDKSPQTLSEKEVKLRSSSEDEKKKKVIVSCQKDILMLSV